MIRVSPVTDSLVVNKDLLQITKSFTDDPVAPGGTVTLQFALANLDTANAASGIAFTDDLSATLTGLMATGLPASGVCNGSGTLSGPTTLSFSGGSLAAGAMCTFSVTLTLPATVSGTMFPNTTSEVTGTINSLAVRGDPASDTLLVNTLTFTKAFGGSLIAGGTQTLTFTITNLDMSSGIGDLSFSDNLGAVVPGLTVTGALPTNPCGISSTVAGTSFLTFKAFNLAAGGMCTFPVTVTVPSSAAGSFTNTTSDLFQLGITKAVPANSSLNVVTEADLSVTKTDGLTVAVPGSSTLTYTIVASNAGPSDDPSVTLTDTFPADLSCTFTSVAGGGATGNTAASSGNLAEMLSMPSGSTVTYTVTCNINSAATGTLSNTATISGSGTDPNVGNNSATDADTVLSPMADVAVTKSDGVTSAAPGSTLTYTIVASNAGPSDDPSVTLTDTFPADLSCTFTSVAGGGATGNTAAGSGNLAEMLSMPSGSTVTYTVTCNINSAATGTLSNTATISGSETDPNAGNNSATDADTVLSPETDLSIVKDDGGAPFVPGSNLTYTLTVTNNGPSDSTGGTITDVLPAGLTFVSSTSGCTEAGGTVTCSFGALANGANTVLTFVARLDPGQAKTIVNTAIVSANETDPNSSNNSASETTSLLPVFSKSFAPDPIAAGGISTLTFTVDNTGAVIAATSLSFGDNLPSGVVVATPPNAATTCTGGTLTAAAGATSISYSVGTVAASSTCTVTVDVTSSTAGTYTNTSGDLTSSSGNSGGATDTLSVVGDVIAFLKSFIPFSGSSEKAVPSKAGIDLQQAGQAVLRGGRIDLEYTISNNSAVFPLTGMTFTDNLDATIPGLAAVGLPANDICGVGSQISGTTLLTFSNGSLAPNGSCTFSLTMQVPTNAPNGTFTSTTSQITGLAGGAPVTQNPAAANLQVVFLDFSKNFLPASVTGKTATLEFTINNPDPANSVTDITFTDDLAAALPGLMASGLPANDACGAGSQLTGTSIITLTGGSLGPGASCIFSVTLQVPTNAPAGGFTNVTSALQAQVGGNSVTLADPAQSVLTGDLLAIPMLSGWGLVVLGGLLILLAWRRLALG